jgi:Zn-dependent peptidase ImmA (M78 family)
LTPREAVDIDQKVFIKKGGEIRYPFPIEDFALRVFGLDIQYEDFSNVFTSDQYDPGELFGCLFPKGRPFQGIDNLILVNSCRKPFVLAGKEVPREYYQEYADRQTIAHEVGHYSDAEVHHVESQPELFDPKIHADAATSIIVYPPKQEGFANLYARILLMPDDRVIQVIHRNNLSGTIDLRAVIGLFTKEFEVTQYMIEIRLKELGIHFLNGIYIKNRNRYPYRKYSCEDLLTLIEVAKSYSRQHGYYDADSYVKQFNMLTGQTRASGALYMTLWRIMQGKYDDRFPEVFEKRVVDLAEFNPESLVSGDESIESIIEEEE